MEAFEQDPRRRTLDVGVVETGQDDDRPYAVLDATVLYPEGGGQPADHGYLDRDSGPRVRVTDVQRRGGVIHHYLETPVDAGGSWSLELDWARRFDHMQQHTAQHLLTAVAADRFGWPTTSFHLRPGICDIEIEAPDLSNAQLEALERAVVDEILARRPVHCRRVSVEEYADLDVRSRGLPKGYTGDIRLVEIEGLDLNTCGGTHLAHTGEIESLKLLGYESRRGGQRLFWVAGSRVRQRLGDHETRNSALRKILGAADEDLVSQAELKLTKLDEALKRQRFLAKRWAEAEAERLAGSEDVWVEAHYDDSDAAFLQVVARRFQTLSSHGAACLTAQGAAGIFLVIVAGPEASVDAAEAGRQVVEHLGGRGGGKGPMFQGKVESLENRAAALDAIRRSVK